MQAMGIGLCGVGTVGAGLVRLLARNHDVVMHRAGRMLELRVAADRHPAHAQALCGSKVSILDDVQALTKRNDIEVVVELLGGTDVAKHVILSAMANHKHVVTANKKLLAEHGNELFATAQQQGVILAFEAAIAGGIPIVKVLREGLVANRIEQIVGIINGTSNFVLTQMSDNGLLFSEAVAQAQKEGYAEADPRFDVEGHDAAHKLSILSALAFGVPIQYDRVYVEGISQLDPIDLQYARQLGYHVKLLGITRQQQQGIELRVHPTLVPQTHLLANVNGVMNAVLIQSDALGESLYYGAGAGAAPTASAVIADLIDITRFASTTPERRVPYLAFQSRLQPNPVILPISKITSCYYLRMRVQDYPGVLADISQILAQSQISIGALLQKETPQQHSTDVIIITHAACEGGIQTVRLAIETLACVEDSVTVLRLEHL